MNLTWHILNLRNLLVNSYLMDTEERWLLKAFHWMKSPKVGGRGVKCQMQLRNPGEEVKSVHW